MAEQEEVSAAQRQRPLRAASTRAGSAPTPRAAAGAHNARRPSPARDGAATARPSAPRPSAAGTGDPKAAAPGKQAPKPARAAGEAKGATSPSSPARSRPAARSRSAASAPAPGVVAATATQRRRTAVLRPAGEEATADIDLRYGGLDEAAELDDDAAFEDDLAQWLAAADDHVEATEGAREKRTGSSRRRRSLIAAAVVVTAVIAALGWQVLSQRNEINRYNNLDAQRSTVLRVASKAAVDMTTYNYQHLPLFFSTIESESTANYITVVEKDKTLLSEAFTQGHASSSATVAGSGISSMTANSAVVVLFVDQTVTNTLTKTPTKDLSRVELTLLRQHNQWLVDQVSLP